MKSRDGKSQGREEKRREEKKEDQKRESLRRKIQVREKVGKSRNTVFFTMICGSGGPKSRLAKAAGAEPAGQMRDEKIYAVVARSTFPSQNVESTPGSDHFWKVRWWKSARRCGAKHMSKSECTKNTRFGPLLQNWDDEKVHAVVARSTFQSQKCQRLTGSEHFWTFRCRFTWQAQGILQLVRWTKREGFCSISKNDGRRGTFEEDLARFIFRGKHSTRDTFIRDVSRSGRWFPEKGCILEHQILSFGKMILRDRCSTSHDLASPFCGRRSTLDRWSGKSAKPIGTRPSALHSTFHFWRKSCRIVCFWCCQLRNWESLANLFRFWCCQI